MGKSMTSRLVGVMSVQQIIKGGMKGDCDSGDFDVITMEESKATPPPINPGFTNKRKTWWDSFI
jgi:hypothetical protein